MVFLSSRLYARTNLTGSLLRIPFGSWVDKAGGKKPFIILLLLSCLGMAGLTVILYSFYPEHMTRRMYPLIILFCLLSGCGIATFSVGVPQTSYWYPEKKQGFVLGAYGGLGNIYVKKAPGRASGWVDGLGAFGGFAVPLILGIFIDSLGVSGYSMGFVVYLALSVISIIISLTLMNRKKHRTETQELKHAS